MSSQFLSRLWLNVDPFTSVSLVSGSVTGDATVGSVSSSSNGENGAAGNKFDVFVLFETANNPGRLTGNETVGFHLTGTGLDAAAFQSLTNNGIPVGAQIQGITGGLSSHVTVPEPGSACSACAAADRRQPPARLRKPFSSLWRRALHVRFGSRGGRI